MARLSKLISALLHVERESPDNRRVEIEIEPFIEPPLQVIKVNDDGDRIVLVARRPE